MGEEEKGGVPPAEPAAQTELLTDEQLAAELEKSMEKKKQEPIELKEGEEGWQIVQKKDEEQILAALDGRVVEDFVYKFKGRDGKTEKALTWSGIKFIGSMKMQLSVEDIQWKETDKSYCVAAKCVNKKTGVVLWGAAEQLKKMKTIKDGQTIIVDDEHALAKATTKAQRNAMRAHIPEEMVLTILDEYADRKLKQKQAGK